MEKDLLLLAEKLGMTLTLEVIGTTIVMKSNTGRQWKLFQVGIKYKDPSKVYQPFQGVAITELNNIEEIYANI